MKRIANILIAMLLIAAGPIAGFGQGVGINTAGSNPNPAAVLDVQSTTQGMLTPRMTQAQRNAIAGPATGLLIYQTDNRPGFRFFDGTDWVYLRGMTSVPGRIDIETGCVVTTYSPTAYPGFSSTYDCVNGTGQVNWPAGIFQNPPVVNLSSAVVPVPPPAPDIYCIPQYTADCGSFINADQITGVRINESTTGIGGPYNNIMEYLSGCNTTIFDGNYVVIPTGTATATLSGNVGGACNNHFYQVEVRSSFEWSDNCYAWIDWNADGDFADVALGEAIHAPQPSLGASAGNWVVSNNFQVPNTALNGNTVMRVRTNWEPLADLQNACEGDTWGETEDYTLTIDCATDGPAPEVTSICTVVNITTTSFDYKCTLLSGFPTDPPEVNFDLVPVE